MKLDRNLNEDKTGKYALINLRRILERRNSPIYKKVVKSLAILDEANLIDWGQVGEDDEFFVIKLKDENASRALSAYADSVGCNGDFEFAKEVLELAKRANLHPDKKRPD